jgi:hypothetical protein
MQDVLDPLLVKELGEAKAALARHGIVILRGVERELEPAIMVSVRDSLASSPGRLREMDDEELDALMEKTRKAVMRSAKELSKTQTRLLAKLGTEYVGDLANELDAIGQAFKWERIAKTAEVADRSLTEKGFGHVTLGGPGDVSEAFALELEEKWPQAFERFRGLVKDAAKKLEESGAAPAPPPRPKKKKRSKK